MTFLDISSGTVSELQEMTDKITSQDIDGTTVKVEMVKPAKPSIRVYNISTLCNEEFLKMYFSNPGMSGGGDIESVTVVSQTEAIVTFLESRGTPFQLFLCFACQ